MQTNVLYYTAFTTDPAKGNPAGIVLDGDLLADVQKQEVARLVGLNETAFVCQPTDEEADVHLRYFTPGHEVPLCGHATIATLFALKTQGALPDWQVGKDILLQTKAGLLPMGLREQDGQLSIFMRQNVAQFHPFGGSVEALAEAMGLTLDDIDMSLPVLYGSTGIWTLIVPIRTLDACKRMQPHNASFPSILIEMPHVSVHPFCLETIDSHADIHARHFSSPYSGTIEDSVTGTASGVLGAYYIEYVRQSDKAELLVEQGFEMGRDGRVDVCVERSDNGIQVSIAGTAAYMRVGEIEY